eukprot:11199776-Lingulodinium_polyedra.AAC.1
MTGRLRSSLGPRAVFFTGGGTRLLVAPGWPWRGAIEDPPLLFRERRLQATAPPGGHPGRSGPRSAA